jgi:hypothetical protein
VHPVVNDEGLHSYKAIAFIRSNPKCLRVKLIEYLILGAFLRNTVLPKQKTFRGFSKNLGEKLWTN